MWKGDRCDIVDLIPASCGRMVVCGVWCGWRKAGGDDDGRFNVRCAEVFGLSITGTGLVPLAKGKELLTNPVDIAHKRQPKSPWKNSRCLLIISLK